MTSVGLNANSNKVLFVFPLKKITTEASVRCAHSLGFSEVLLIRTQSYFLSDICVTANQQHSYCLPIMILTASNYTNFVCTVLGPHKSFGVTFMPFLLDD